ncbi:MAG: LemA family protein [Planctomycetota bacterium]|jgi:LemA protein|nr:LemA family protein [Planctomycetota bacterium]
MMETGNSLVVFLSIIGSFLLILVIALIWGIRIYNKLVSGRNGFENAFGQIDVQLTRRYDLIPNLVETAKGYMKHERETLEAVIEARNQAASATQQVARAPGDPQAMQQLMGAEAALTGTLGRLFALAEAYPDLKANSNMLSLQDELTSTEDKVSYAREGFNNAVTRYNILRESFPDLIIASMFKFDAAELFVVDAPEQREAPKVSFS